MTREEIQRTMAGILATSLKRGYHIQTADLTRCDKGAVLLVASLSDDARIRMKIEVDPNGGLRLMIGAIGNQWYQGFAASEAGWREALDGLLCIIRRHTSQLLSELDALRRDNAQD